MMKKILKTAMLIVTALLIAASLFACKKGKDDGGDGTDSAANYLRLSHYEATVEVGESVTLTASSDLSLDGLTWRSEDDAIATVQNGTVTGVKEGRVKIVAQLSELTAQCTVTVTASSDASDLRLVLDTRKKYLTVGESFVLRTDLYDNETPLTNEVACAGQSDCVTVTRIEGTNTFTVAAAKAGVTTVTATYGDLTATAQIVVKNADATSLPAPDIAVDTTTGMALAISVDEAWQEQVAGFEIEANLGQYKATVAKDGNYSVPQSLIAGDGVQSLTLYVKATAADDNAAYFSGDYAAYELIVVQDGAERAVYDKEFLRINSGILQYNANVIGAELIAEKDGEEITLPASGSSLQDLAISDTLRFYAKKGNKKVAYLGGYEKYSVESALFSNYQKSETWSTTTYFDFDDGNVYDFNIPATNNNSRYFPLIEFTTTRDLTNLVALSYDIKLTADTTADAPPESTDYLYFLPNIVGSAQTRTDQYGLTESLLPDKSTLADTSGKGLSIKDGWQTVSMTGLRGVNTTKTVSSTAYYPIKDNGDGTFTVQLTFINRWNSAATANPKDFHLSISNLQFELVSQPLGEEFAVAMYSARYSDKNNATSLPSHVSVSIDAQIGYVYDFQMPTNYTQPILEFTTTQNLTNLIGVSYKVKITEDTESTDSLYFLPNVPGSEEDRGDGKALTSALISGKNGITMADGWQSVTLSGLQGIYTSLLNQGFTYRPIKKNADGTYTLQLTLINRWNDASSGSAKNFRLLISDLEFEFAEQPLTETYSIGLYSGMSGETAWTSRMSVSDDAQKGKVYTFRLPTGGANAYPMISFTTVHDLTNLKGLRYDVKVTADTTTTTIGESDSLKLLPNVPGSSTQSRSDGYAGTSDLISGKSGLTIADEWQTATITGLDGTNTKKTMNSVERHPIIDNGDGTYTIQLTFINRWNSDNSIIAFNLSISNLQFVFE